MGPNSQSPFRQLEQHRLAEMQQHSVSLSKAYTSRQSPVRWLSLVSLFWVSGIHIMSQDHVFVNEEIGILWESPWNWGKKPQTTKQKIFIAISQISIFLGLLLKFIGALWSYFKEGTNRMSWNQLTFYLWVLWKVLPVFFSTNRFGTWVLLM